MAGPVYGSGFVDLKPQLAGGFGASIAAKLGPVGSAAAGVFAATFGAAIAGGAALAAIGGSFDSAFDTIRVGTGATGKALDGLKESFRDVVAEVPASFGDASTAIADINTRLGLTGDDLEGVSGQFLELSRITGTDVAGNVESLSRTFGDWAVAQGDTSDAMDKLFRASQATGPSVAALGDLLVQYGAPLRQLGFGFEESAALLGKFEKEGVNTELVMGSLRIALGKMARAGEDSQETFTRVVEDIENAGSASEANALALELFGARAGPDMAAAIREGRFAVGDLFDTVASGSETILGAAEDTRSWQQSWQELKNNVLLALEPIATRVFDALSAGMEALIPAFQTAVAAARPFVTAVVDGFQRAQVIVGPVVATIVTAVAKFAAGLSASSDTVGGWSDRLETVFGRVRELVTAAMGAVEAIIGTAIEIVTGFWNRFGRHLVAYATRSFGRIVGIISGAWDVIVGIFEAVTAALRGDWSGFWNAIKKIVSGAWRVITGVVTQAWDAIKTAFGAGVAIVSQLWSALWNAVKTAVAAAWRNVKSAVSSAWSTIKSAFTGGASAVRGAWSALWSSVLSTVSAAWRNVVSAARSGVSNLVGVVRGLPGRIIAFFTGAGTWLLDAGRRIIGGLISGITERARAIGSAVSGIASRIRGFFPGSPVKEGPLTVLNRGRAGGNIVQMIADGMRAETAQLAAAADEAARAAMVNLSVPRMPNLTPTTAAGATAAGRAGGLGSGVTVQGDLVVQDRTDADAIAAGLAMRLTAA